MRLLLSRNGRCRATQKITTIDSKPVSGSLNCSRWRRDLKLSVDRRARAIAPTSSSRHSRSLSTGTLQQPRGREPAKQRREGPREQGAAWQGSKAQQGDAVRNRKLTKRQKERAEKEEPQRLAKVIARAGIASRRKAEDLITSGLVRVNNKEVKLPQHLVLASVDNITVSGKPVPKGVQKYYFALNKPKGYLCANSSNRDSGQQKLVVDLFRQWIETVWKSSQRNAHAVPPRLYTVGRLDVQTTGLVFVTNDGELDALLLVTREPIPVEPEQGRGRCLAGEWAQTVQHPSRNLTKEYIVTLQRPPTAQQMTDISLGSVVDGAFVRPKLLGYAVADRKDKLRVVVGEGRNREVRVLVENVGLSVSALKRVRVGGYRLPNDLSIGEFRELKPYVAKRVIEKSIEMNPETNPVLRML